MSHFIDSEAEESEEEEGEYSEKEKKRLKKIQLNSDSSEEEEDDEAKIQEENKGFIDDSMIDDDEEDEGSGSESDTGKRKRDEDDDDDLDADNLDEDDLDLIEENIGVKIDRKKKFKRLKRIEDEDSEGEEGDARDQIANELFQVSGDEEEEEEGPPPQRPPQTDEYGSEEGEESDEDNFIVDDEGKPIQRPKKKVLFEDEGLEAARDIFGCDFDYGEFEQYDDWAEGEEEEEEDDYDEEEDEGEREKRRARKERRKVVKKSIYEVFEPSELERGHLTDQDQEIRKTDLPERFQLRQIPVTRTRGEGEDRAGDKELDQEAKWIYHYAFYKPFVSNQEGREKANSRSRRDHHMIQKIYNALDLMRNATCEVPFIAFYRKEEVQPELNIHDLWKVYKWDEKWCQLQARKENLKSLFHKMSEYQGDLIMKDIDAPLPENLRPIKEEEVERVDECETSEQFNDYYKQFLLYYGKDQPEMREHIKAKRRAITFTRKTTKVVKVLRKVKRKKKRKKANIDEDDEENEENQEKDKENEEGEGDEEEEEEEVETEVETEVEEEVEEEQQDQEDENDALKKAVRRHEYELLRRAGIESLTKKFGLTPEQFGENIRDNYQRYEVEQFPEDPMKEAEQYISKMCSTPERVLEAAVRMVGWQLACEPMVRRAVREVYFDRARINVRPTPQGVKMIDEHHILYSSKYIKDKPVTDLEGDQFLRIKMGVEDKIVTFSLSDTIEGTTSLNFIDEAKQLYYRDEFSQVVQDWNDLRGRAVEFAMKRIIEDLKRELTQRLLQEARDHVVEQCCSRLYNWLKVAPYNPGDFSDEDEDDWDTSRGFRVFAVAFVPDLSQAAFGCCIDIDGDCCEYIRIPHLLKRRNAYNERDAMAKENDVKRMREFIIRRKPHVVVVGAESREGMMVADDLKQILKDLEEQEQFPKINVELIDNELSSQYQRSKKGEADFLDYPPLLRQAISLGRRIQDPLIEFSQLCNPDEEILNLRYHQLQEQINPQELMEALYTEFVNRTNEVGVDLNRAVAYPYTQHLVQFVCGLGPRKANALIKSMKQNNHRLENRNQLVVSLHMGAKVFINCAGFIKIDTNALGDSDNYIEVLDSTRIHPEAYDWARKMAVDALEYEDEEGKPAEALEEILETPERLSELDLEAFATELQNQGFGKKNTTLYDIRHELNHRYKDFRVPFKTATPEEVFNMLTKESPETFYVGKLVQSTVINFIHRKPRGDQLDNANPVRNEDSGLWQCPFCLKNDFPELSEVWNHFDAGDCPGQAIGIRVRLDNGISGFISIKNLSDKTVTNPAERVRRNGLIHCRIMKIDPEKFSVELTSRTSDLQDRDNKWKLPKDAYYDMDSEETDFSIDKKKMEKKKNQYQKRVIAHPSFKNCDFNEAEKIMNSMEQGDVIIRPSSKGVDHLTVTWKVTEGICQHIDIREQDKLNDFSLGQKLWIGNEEFEDLDEIIARHVAPIAANVRQILEYKYYKESYSGNKEKCSEFLKEEKKKNPKNIPYIFTAMKNLPGKFMLSYLPRVKVIHEYVSVTPEGFRFRRMQFSTMSSLLKWFKLNFRKLGPGMGATTPGMMSTRTPYLGGTTPSMLGVDASTIHKVAQNLPSHMLHNLSQAASTTPYANTPGAYSHGYSNYANTPYTPSGQTPYMTPYATPGPSTTPRYGSHTPSHNTASSSYPPSQHGSRTPSSHRPTHHQSHQSHQPHHHNHHHNRNSGSSTRSEQTDWSKAAEAWARARTKDGRNTPGRSTPRGYNDQPPPSGRYNHHPHHTYGEDVRRTPHYEDRGTPRPYHDYDIPRATPRSARSTPKTIHSPTNMSIGGDQTPLYDE